MQFRAKGDQGMRAAKAGWRTVSGFIAAAVLAAVLNPAAKAMDEEARLAVGTVHFAVSCNEQAQVLFNRAMTAYYLSRSDEAGLLFAEVVQADRECGMGHWGQALLALGDLYAGPPPIEGIVRGIAALEQTIFAEPRTRRERQFLEAISVYYIDTAQFDHYTRLLRMAEAFARLVRAQPDDSEAAVLFGYVLSATALPTERSYWRQRRAGELFGQVLEQQPYHPGALYFLLRSYGPTALASRARGAAERYAELRPQSPAALTALSQVLAATEGGTESTDAAGFAPAARHSAGEAGGAQALRDLDQRVYALLQNARDDDALEIVENRSGFGALSTDPLALDTALAVIPARYALERHAWSEAARLPLRESPHAYPSAATHFARALGFARTGRVERARLDVGALDRLRARTESGADSVPHGQIEVLYLAAHAWLSYAEGATLEAEARMRKAILTEESAAAVASHGADRLLPMQELYGELLLQLRDYPAALAAFETVLQQSEYRFRSVFGAGRAAELGQNWEMAAHYYRRLLDLAPNPQGNRFELGIANNYFARLAAGG
jgi:tetratricopeptide (TPR) repeat protein